MKRFWELIINARGADRFYCFPFLLLFRLIAPVYQLFSMWHLRQRRARCSREWRASVISIGNITVGGSGKTPIAMEVAGRLSDKGKKVAIIHSGYGRSRNTQVVINYGLASQFSVSQIGDEVAVMAKGVRRAAFAIGANKKKSLKAIDEKLNPDVVILDDGYQRLDIEKEIDIAVVDVSLIATGGRHRLFPGGILREPLTALGRADAVFLTCRDDEAVSDETLSAIRRYSPKSRIMVWSFSFDQVTRNGEKAGWEQLKQSKPFLFAGIASFDRLLAMIEKSGIILAGYYRFGDHYDYDKLDIDHLEGLAGQVGADSYLTTAKDMVKLAHLSFERPLYCLHLKARPIDAARFEQLIDPEAA